VQPFGPPPIASLSKLAVVVDIVHLQINLSLRLRSRRAPAPCRSYSADLGHPRYGAIRSPDMIGPGALQRQIICVRIGMKEIDGLTCLWPVVSLHPDHFDPTDCSALTIFVLATCCSTASQIGGPSTPSLVQPHPVTAYCLSAWIALAEFMG